MNWLGYCALVWINTTKIHSCPSQQLLSSLLDNLFPHDDILCNWNLAMVSWTIQDIDDEMLRLHSGGILSCTFPELMGWLDDMFIDSLSGNTVGRLVILPRFLETPAFSQSIYRQSFCWYRLKRGWWNAPISGPVRICWNPQRFSLRLKGEYLRELSGVK